MKAVFVLLDSLNRNALESYAENSNILTPNFKRFQEKCITFDNHYVGSLPCIPARRDLHTGRINFLHRSWGPLEPFDDSFPELMKKNGILLIDDLLLDVGIRKKGYKFYEEVMGGVFLFLKKKKNYKFLYTGHQLILKKI